MSPNYFVFCEGDTEVAYTEMLRAHYRLPIHIIAKKLTAYNNPSTTVYQLIEDLEKLKKELVQQHQRVSYSETQ